jgi:plastocyanin
MQSRLTIRLSAGAITALATMASWAAVSSAQGASSGSIKGHVKLAGALQGNPIIRMGMDPKCAQANAGRRVVQEAIVEALDGSLGNVFVRLEGTFPPTPVPKESVVIDQRACVYQPRVVGARVGQTLEIKNSDDWLHNVHSLSARGNTFNISEPKAGMVQQFKLKDEEVMLRIKCDVHSWMTSYVGVVNNPYFAVTNTAGTFEIANVPAGSFTIQVWQERYGPLSQAVRVRAGAATTVDFTYTGTEKASQ